jgi:hypothetical protein
MAIVKNFITESGIESNYWKIVNYRMSIDFITGREFYEITVNGYRDKDWRFEKNINNNEVKMTANETISLADGDMRDALYVYLKTLAFFEDAVDDV